jgi:arthrofactin-type cyclic lipopeptide synthetase C
MDLAEAPHETVEEASLYNLRALTEFLSTQTVHLLGHSHGGLVAFEMAVRLHEQQRHVASVTLIDTEPPDPLEKGSHGINAAGIFREFIEVLEDNFDRTLDVDDAAIRSGDVQTFTCVLHAALVKYHLLPARSAPDVLRGPLAVFTAARRSIYLPNRRYPGTVHLALVSCHRLDEHDKRTTYARKWRDQVAELNVWYGPGTHSSILQFPHAKSLAEWWMEARKADSRRQG